jgi:DNA-binding transcriptional LysR family regulator
MSVDGRRTRVRTCVPAAEPPVAGVHGSSHYQEIEAMVAARMGIAMVPRLAVAHHRPDVRAVRFRAEDRVPTRSIYIASLSRREYTPSMYAIARALHEAAQRIAGAAD